MRTALTQGSLGALAVAVLMMAGCSQSTVTPGGNGQSTPAAAPAAPVEPVSAKTAFWPMYKAAMTWSSDAELIRITQKEVPGFTNAGGKAAMWEAAFASPSKHQGLIYTYAIATVLPDIHKGTTAGNPQPWAGETRDAMPIDVSVFNIDSDAAYQTAAAQAAPWLAKNPTIPLTSLELGNDYTLQSPAWYVAWGTKKFGFITLVNGTTGVLYKSKT